ncbi:hypothetical protein P2318_14105 [Myxococcaceae bacterium GXIMD 01537]
MRLKLALSAALLFAVPAFAESAPASAPKDAASKCERKQGKLRHRASRMEGRMDRLVEAGRLTREQADAFKAEARQLEEETRSSLSATSCQLTDAQREQLRARREALRDKVKSAVQATKPAKGS